MQVTIVTPVYNGEKDLLEAFTEIESLLSPELNWLIVNDCSTDDTLASLNEICRKNKNIHFINLKENSGPSVARYTGVEFAKSDYVFFLDADDVIINNALLSFIDFCSKKEKDFYYAPLKGTTSRNEVIVSEDMKNHKIHEINSPIDFIKYGFPQPSSLMVERRFFLDNVKPDRLQWGEDFLLFLQLSKNGNGIRWSDVVSLYVITGSGRGSKLSFKLRMNLSYSLFLESFKRNKVIDSFYYTLYLTLRHSLSYIYKRLRER